MKPHLMIWAGVAVACVIGVLAGYQAGWRSIDNLPAEAGTVVELTGPAAPKPARERVIDAASLPSRMREAVASRDRSAQAEIADALADMREKELWELLAEVDATEDSAARREMVEAVLRRLGELNPPAAFAEAERLLKDRYLTNVWGHILRSWAEFHPEAALAKAVEMAKEYPGTRALVISSVFGAWVEHDFEGAIAQAGALKNSRHEKVAVQSIADHAVSDENLRGRLLEIAGSFDDPGLQEEFLSRAMNSWGHKAKIAEVEEWIDAQELNAELQADLLRSLALGASWQNPRSAADWLMARSTESSRSGDLEAAIEQWVHFEPEACGKWLLEQATGPDADEALDRYSSTIAHRDPAEALTWAAHIHDDELRQQRLEKTVRNMELGPPGHLEKTLAQSGLPEDVVQSLLVVAKRED